MSFLNRKESSLLPVFVVGSVCVQIISFLILTITFGKVGKIADAKTPVLVELADGTSARVTPQAFNERSPQAITRFVGETLVSLMSWNITLQTAQNLNPTAKTQLDEGVQAGEGKVTTAAWESSFALSEDFRSTFLAELAKLTSPEVFTGKTQSLLLVRRLSEPQKIASGKWRQDVIANLVVLNSGKQTGKALPFNKTVFIRSIDTPKLPKGASPVQIAAYKARLDGLEIYKIQDLVQQ